MLVKKLTVPLISGNILRQARACYIASAAISERGFDFICSRLPKTCITQIVTGLDLPTHPNVLRQILNELNQTVTLKVFTENFFHPKVYIFELEDGTKAGFLGSGNFTMGGLQKNEEVFCRIDDVESLKIWFDNYFEKAKPLTADIIEKYEALYPSINEREKESRREKKQFNDLITGAFNWDNIDFHGQYFIREDYLAFENSKAPLNTDEVRAERIIVQNKLLELHDDLKDLFCYPNNLHEHYDSNHIVSSLDPINHHEYKVRAMWLAYGRSFKQLRQYSADARHMDFIRLQVIIRQQDFGIWLMPGKKQGGREDREYFKSKMREQTYREKFFSLLTDLGKPYWIEVNGTLKDIDSFADPNELWQFTQEDDWVNYYFTIGRDYDPGDKAISETNILSTIVTEFTRLFPLYQLMKDKSFD